MSADTTPRGTRRGRALGALGALALSGGLLSLPATPAAAQDDFDQVAGLKIVFDENQNPAPGDQLTFTATVVNPSSMQVDGYRVYSPTAVGFIDVSWTCAANGAATSCGAASGTGLLDDTFSLGANGSLVYVLTGTVDPNNPVPFTQAVAVIPPDDEDCFAGLEPTPTPSPEPSPSPSPSPTPTPTPSPTPPPAPYPGEPDEAEPQTGTEPENPWDEAETEQQPLPDQQPQQQPTRPPYEAAAGTLDTDAGAIRLAAQDVDIPGFDEEELPCDAYNEVTPLVYGQPGLPITGSMVAKLALAGSLLLLAGAAALLWSRPRSQLRRMFAAVRG